MGSEKFSQRASAGMKGQEKQYMQLAPGASVPASSSLAQNMAKYNQIKAQMPVGSFGGRPQ